MSDWLSTLNAASLLATAAACLGWAVGGWLVGHAWTALRPGERLLGGMAAGFVAYLTLVNLLTPLLGLWAASLGAAALILATGLWAAWRARITPAELRADLRDWPQVVILLALTLVFELAQRGVSLFDEYLHLPLVSIMGTGSIPPRFYLNPDLMFAYHYGLQIFAAVLEGLGRFFPWSAWDLTRGLAIAWTLGLGWLWVRRGTGRAGAATLGTLLLAFGGGARWLLLFLPGSALAWIGQGVQLSNTGADTAATLAQALSRPWASEGSGAVPFPFAFHNGVFIPWTFFLGSTGALPAVTLLLLLLLARPYPNLRNPGGLALLVLIFANLALSAEHLFAFLWLAVVLAGALACLQGWRRRQPIPRDQILGWGIVLLASGLLSVFQGGFITETLRNQLLALQGLAPAVSNLYGFKLRWPPAIVSAHLGLLSPLDLRQLITLLLEAGPALLVAPLATRFAWRAARRGDWLTGGIGLAALLMVVFTLFVEYGVDRSSTRFAGSSLWMWLALAFPLLWRAYQRAGSAGRAWLGGLYGITLWAGLVLFAIQLTAAVQPQPAYYMDSLDLAMSRKYWNRLEAGAQVLDDYPERAVTVFGRIDRANSDIYVLLPEFKALMENPTPQKAAAAGYSYVYLNQLWWNKLMSPAVRQSYAQACVRVVDEMQDADGGRFRRLVDVRGCR